METVTLILSIVGTIFAITYSYYIVFLIVGILSKKRKYKDAKTNHTFAILVCARNEQKVIGNLIESIKNNDYPQENIRIFVCADNCTDDTATTCRSFGEGVTVYERFNKEQIGKGFALQYLFSQIAKDFPDYVPDAIMFFDADNVLTKNYVKEMNKALDSGVKICTSYRNSKNFGSGWIAACSSLSFMKECQMVHRPKMVLKLSTHVSGTGFYFSKDVLTFKDGWNYTMITEDIEFSTRNILKNVKIGYCEDAEFFDEQPTKFYEVWKQRCRWSRGMVLGLVMFTKSLISKFFRTFDFNCYEYFFARFFPASVYYALSFAISNVIYFVNGLVNYFGILQLLLPLIISFLSMCLGFLIDSSVAVLLNWKKITAPAYKKILSIFLYPIFTMTVVTPSCFVALFKKVKWLPIVHNESISQQDLEQR